MMQEPPNPLMHRNRALAVLGLVLVAGWGVWKVSHVEPAGPAPRVEDDLPEGRSSPALATSPQRSDHRPSSESRDPPGPIEVFVRGPRGDPLTTAKAEARPPRGVLTADEKGRILVPDSEGMRPRRAFVWADGFVPSYIDIPPSADTPKSGLVVELVEGVRLTPVTPQGDPIEPWRVLRPSPLGDTDSPVAVADAFRDQWVVEAPGFLPLKLVDTGTRAVQAARATGRVVLVPDSGLESLVLSLEAADASPVSVQIRGVVGDATDLSNHIRAALATAPQEWVEYYSTFSDQLLDSAAVIRPPRAMSSDEMREFPSDRTLTVYGFRKVTYQVWVPEHAPVNGTRELGPHERVREVLRPPREPWCDTTVKYVRPAETPSGRVVARVNRPFLQTLGGFRVGSNTIRLPSRAGDFGIDLYDSQIGTARASWGEADACRPQILRFERRARVRVVRRRVTVDSSKVAVSAGPREIQWLPDASRFAIVVGNARSIEVSITGRDAAIPSASYPLEVTSNSDVVDLDLEIR